ncbi:MAG: ParB/RepB/Spo0J family partition protein [Solirubrobacteraceae bacterium]
MPKHTFSLDPVPLLFDVSTLGDGELPARIERVPLEHLELAPNPRREIGDEGIDRLAKMLCSSGQLVPCIGWRPDPDQPQVILYDGQRRYLAAQASHGLAGSEYMDGLAEPIRSLIVLLLDHAPSAQEIRRLQAHCQQREELTLSDQQQQFEDCWQARAGLREPDRIAAVCAELGISPKRAHNLRRQLTLPEQIRARVAERPASEQISVTMANKLADMHELAPRLTEAVAKRIATSDLHDKALRDLGAFVHRTVVEDEHTYAVRIDDGAMLDAAEQINLARSQLSDFGRHQIAGILGCEPERVDAELDTLAARAKSRALKLRINGEVRDRARNGRYAFVHDRGRDFAAGIWVVDPAFMIDLVRQQLQDDQSGPAREEAYFAGGRLDDDELRDAAAEDEQRRAGARARHAEATRSNLGLGHDIRAGLIKPSDAQLRALRDIVCLLLVRHYGELIAYGAGWTDPERQRPVGDTGRHEPQHPDAIVAAELERALEDLDPLRGIAQLTARWAAAFVLHPDAVTRTKALGTERTARKLSDALPGGEDPLRMAVWELMRPMLSPTLAALNRDAFINDHDAQTTVDLDRHRSASNLDELDLDESHADQAA